VPREPYNLLRNSQTNDYDTAYFWALGHSWMCNFGLFGQDAEGEEPRTRVLLTKTNPAIVLFEFNSLSTFNMLDPVIGADIDAMNKAVAENLMNRTRHSSQTPVGYVLQGVGPHFCPGGNHHPVAPPGGTPFQMGPHITSIWNVKFRQHALPGITAIQGSAVGGGVAVSTNTTQRVAVANASLSFGNLSRGASPLMWLSGNLVDEMGTANAVALYLTDSTVSAYGALKSGLIAAVGSSIANTKNRAMLMARALASAPATRLVANHHLDLDTHRFAREALGFQFNSKSGSMFANIKGENVDVLATKRPIKRLTTGSKADNADKEDEDGANQKAQSSSATKKKETPKPFPSRATLVESSELPCARCGGEGLSGTNSGDFFYCSRCLPRADARPISQATTVQTPIPVDACDLPCGVCQGQGAAGMISGNDFYCKNCWNTWESAQNSAKTCCYCGVSGVAGSSYGAEYYCTPCWSWWENQSGTSLPGTQPGSTLLKAH